MDIVIRVGVRNGQYAFRCGRTPDGIAWQPVGCAHRKPKEASAHVDRLKEKTP